MLLEEVFSRLFPRPYWTYSRGRSLRKGFVVTLKSLLKPLRNAVSFLLRAAIHISSTSFSHWWFFALVTCLPVCLFPCLSPTSFICTLAHLSQFLYFLPCPVLPYPSLYYTTPFYPTQPCAAYKDSTLPHLFCIPFSSSCVGVLSVDCFLSAHYEDLSSDNDQRVKDLWQALENFTNGTS